MELLIHLGIDTVELEGAPFTPQVKVGEQVTAGQPLTLMDLAAIKAVGKSTTIMVVITNSKELKVELTLEAGDKKSRDLAAQLKL
ncbi:PTS glucose transporter subunit IIA [Lactobacillus sp. DCY120]|uniref:PTS glucose transporter subunit IIA n=1 Tax=Bombilactobacillus apium TaxID=2675299 RepID=A0A850QZI4_9LACO|nr:PTS glucose transporter subunit IIA [Bombilactobacillus apium]NVY96103.1 PTS glucose transporter subunit IIA [Bombilactobacillus apium]